MKTSQFFFKSDGNNGLFAQVEAPPIQSVTCYTGLSKILGATSRVGASEPNKEESLFLCFVDRASRIFVQ
jgi:hypothetical protein